MKKLRAKDFIDQSIFYKKLHSDILDRIKIIESYPFNKSLLIETSSFKEKIISPSYLEEINLKFNEVINIQEDLTGFASNSYDFILMPFGIHWIENIATFLVSIKHLLTQNGIFIFKTIERDSLSNLHKLFVSLEERHNSAHYLHIIPQISFESMNHVAQQTGFGDIILDQEEISFEFNSALDLMKYIRSIAESNILNHGSYRINKTIYKELIKEKQNLQKFKDSINILTGLLGKNRNSLKVIR